MGDGEGEGVKMNGERAKRNGKKGGGVTGDWRSKSIHLGSIKLSELNKVIFYVHYSLLVSCTKEYVEVEWVFPHCFLEAKNI